MADNIKKCKKCGFILETKPGLIVKNGVCLACINSENKKNIDFAERQKWLTKHIQENITNDEYDCAIAVSGGKDSTTIVRRLFENHGVTKALLIHVGDIFTPTHAGVDNLNNIISRYNVDLMDIKLNKTTMTKKIKEDFVNELHPLKWVEEKITEIPIDIARKYNIKLVFYGENPYYEYGLKETLDIFHDKTDENLEIIYLGAIYPYSAQSWYQAALEVGFKDLNYYNEWQRQGSTDDYSQIDSMGYIIQLWTKFVKFGFQRVSDMACRGFRDGYYTREQVDLLIKESDHLCDPAAKRDFCRAIDITEDYFDEIVDKHANHELVVKDINGVWRRRDLLD